LLGTFFQDLEIKPKFKKEFISIFKGWLGHENLHQLDEVTEVEWARFNAYLRLLHQHYRLCIADLETMSCTDINDIEATIMNHKDSLNKDSSQFTKITIPKLHAVLTEEWDFTWILWHVNNGAVEALSPLIEQADLFHWRD